MRHIVNGSIKMARYQGRWDVNMADLLDAYIEMK